MIHAIAIDDEEISLNALGEKIIAYCPGIKVLKLFLKPEQALMELKELRPDVVFLDIEMPKMNGFSFLKNVQDLTFDVIFTTAYSEYAIEALRICAFDFLLKPVDIKELVSATERLKERIEKRQGLPRQLEQQIQMYLQHQHPVAQVRKIALPVLNGLQFIETNEIVKVRGENVYSTFFLADGKRIVASLTLKETEAMLQRFGFFRVHKSFIVNLQYITHYIKGEGGIVVLSDGSEVEVSRRNKADFLKRFGN